MKPFTKHTGKVVVMDRANVDTDHIIPKQFLKRIERTGFGEFLFWDWARNPDGSVIDEFELNRPEAKGASVLVVRQNFGCGSSREHAPWALTAYGFRAVICTSFADIFRNNSLKNGLLPVIVDYKTHQMLFDLLEEVPGIELTIDLESQTLSFLHGSVTFPIDPFNKTCLLNGTDELGYILGFEKEIAAFEEGR